MDLPAKYFRQPQAFLFLFPGFRCYEHQELMPCTNPPKPGELPPHVDMSCLSLLPAPSPSPFPRAAAHAPAAEYHVVRRLPLGVGRSNRAANPASFMQAARPWRNSLIRFRYAPLLSAPAHPSRLATNMWPPPGCS